MEEESQKPTVVKQAQRSARVLARMSVPSYSHCDSKMSNKSSSITNIPQLVSASSASSWSIVSDEPNEEEDEESWQNGEKPRLSPDEPEPIHGLSGLSKLVLCYKFSKTSTRHSSIRLYHQLKGMDKLSDVIVRHTRHLRLYLWALTDDEKPSLEMSGEDVAKKVIELATEDRIKQYSRKWSCGGDEVSQIKNKVLLTRSADYMRAAACEILHDTWTPRNCHVMDDGLGLLSLCVCQAYLKDFQLPKVESMDLRYQVENTEDSVTIVMQRGMKDEEEYEDAVATCRKSFRLVSVASKLLQPHVKSCRGVCTIYIPKRRSYIPSSREYKSVLQVDRKGIKTKRRVSESLSILAERF